MNNILETSIAFWRSSVLFYAMRMNLFEKMGEKSYTVGEIAGKCNADSIFTGRILRALAAMKMVIREGETYRCSEEILDGIIPGRESNLSHFVRLMNEDFTSGMWAKIPLMPGDKGPVPAIVDEKPASEGLFTMAMQNVSLQGEGKALADSIDTTNHKRMLDLGCGSGAYTIALCKRNPHLTGIMVDMPEAAIISRKIVTELEIDDRIQVIASDWNDFKAEEKFDLVLLSDVLYLREDENLRLLKIAFDSLNDGGQIAVRGYYLDETDDRLFPALFDINILSSNPEHFTPTIEQVDAWLTQTGFTEIGAKPLTEMSYLLTAIKPIPEKDK